MEQLQEQVIQLFTIILGGLLSIASVYVTIYVNKAIQKAKLESAKIQDEQARVIANKTLDQVNMLIQTNVVAMEQTVVKGIKEGIADGKITKEELSNVANQVRENVLAQLSQGSVDILNSTLGDVNGYVNAQIEKQLAELKGQLTIGGVTPEEFLAMQKQLEELKKQMESK